jgi:hypothetical protein
LIVCKDKCALLSVEVVWSGDRVDTTNVEMLRPVAGSPDEEEKSVRADEAQPESTPASPSSAKSVARERLQQA